MAALIVLSGCEGRQPAPQSPAAGSSAAPQAAAPTPTVGRSTPLVTSEPVSCPAPSTDPGRSFPPEAAAAAPALLALFDRAPIVAVGEYHGWQAEHDVFADLVCDPRFPAAVDAIVVEFGNSRLQAILDRCVVDGEDVARTELKRVWQESTQRSGVWNSPVYERFFSLVRHVNADLPRERRIRVLAGDPPIDYATVTQFGECSSEDPACYKFWLERRDESFADVVKNEVLAKDGSALLIAGAGHMIRRIGDDRPPSIPDLIAQVAPGSTLVVVPHAGFGIAGSDAQARIETWPVPSLARLRGTWLEELDACLIDGGGPASGDPPCLDGHGPTLADVADAYLYLGPGAP